METLLQELKRRKVYRITVVYVVASWLLLQITDILFPAFGVDDSALRQLALSLLFAFPLVLILTWIFEITPEGLRVTRPGRGADDVPVSKWDYGVGAFLLLLLFLIGVQVLNSEDAHVESPVPPEAAVTEKESSAPIIPGFSGRSAIAVLPFLNMSDDPSQDYFADGITEDLITGLQSFQSFPIIARTSTFQYKGKDLKDTREIAAELGAGYVIEGSVRKVRDDVRINVQLINHEGMHVWAEYYDFKFEHVLRVQTELVGQILLAIEPELIITEADRTRFVRTEDMEAFDYFLRGITNTFAPFAYTDLNGQAVTAERLEQARRDTLKAVELDADFAAGWRALNHIEGGHAVQLAALLSDEQRQEHLMRGIEYGELSRQLSPFEPSVCSCLAALLLMNGQVDEALLLQEESIKENPSNATARAVMGKIYQITGELDRALEEIQLAKRLSPNDMAMTTYLYFEAGIYQQAGRFREAVDTARRALLLAKNNYDAEFIRILSLLALGERQSAVDAISHLSDRAPATLRPRTGWPDPPPDAVARAIVLSSGESLQGRSYNEVLQLVFNDLGWKPSDDAGDGTDKGTGQFQ